MNQILTLYRNAFGGLSRTAWFLALVMFINRSGAMVVPFMSVYLTEALKFDLKQTGILLSLFGAGSMCGTFLGGWLTDRIGHFKVQLFSLIMGGLWFFVVLQLRSFEVFGGGLFLLSLFTECLRPANASSVSHYAKPENVTRAFSLNRMAINLGFSIGPALGGVFATISYQWLFMADGFTSITAGVLFFFYFRHRKSHEPVSAISEKEPARNTRSPYTDKLFLLFTALCCCFAICFFQFFYTMPLYYRQVYHLSELQIGGLMASNGLTVFLVEMVIVYLIADKHALWKLIGIGLLFLAAAFIIINLLQGLWVLYVSVLLLSFSEMLAMPFMSTLTVERSGPQNRGAYMALYSLAYSAAQIMAPSLGTNMISAYGYETLWWSCSVLAALTAVGLYVVVRKISPAPSFS